MTLLLAFVALPADAVKLAAGGRGEVLLFPYYTVRGSNDTLISIANMTYAGKAVKVRIREGRNGTVVSSFNLYLASHDSWAAALTLNSSGVAVLRTLDNSCTVPALSPRTSVANAYEVALDNTGYANRDRAGSDIQRAWEGYIEVIEMGEVSPEFPLPNPPGPAITFNNAIQPYANACQTLVSAWNDGGAFRTSAGAELTPPTGGLIGSGTLINVPQGTDYAYAPTALSSVFGDRHHTPPGDAHPGLDDASPISVVLGGQNLVKSTWNHGVDAVSAVLMHWDVENRYTSNAGLNAATDVVLTFPTKPYLVTLESDTGATTRPPFSVAFDDLSPRGAGASGPLLADGDSAGACEKTLVERYDDAGWLEETDDIGIPLPPPDPSQLCWTAQIIPYAGSNDTILASQNAASRVHSWVEDGQVEIAFLNAAQKLVSKEGHVYYGLPVIGFALHRYVNGNIAGALSNYGGTYPHSYQTLIHD